MAIPETMKAYLLTGFGGSRRHSRAISRVK
jgi:hypothetical protein